MRGKSTVIVAEKFWLESNSKEETENKIILYMKNNYPDYEVLEIHEHYVICDTGK